GLLTRRGGEVVPCASYEPTAEHPSRTFRRIALIALIALLSAPSLSQGGLVQAQSSADSAAAAAAAAVPADGTVEILPIALRPPPKRPPRFFREETPLTENLTANFNELRGDKMTEDAPWRPAVLTVSGEDSALTSIPVRVRTRGKWRLGNCELPPMRLNFWKDSTRDTPMSGLDKPKLVNLCRDRDAHEEYLLQEYQLYRVYALLTAYSLPARLLRLSYADSGSGRIRTTRWAFLTEEPESLAERMDAVRTEQTGAKGGD